MPICSRADIGQLKLKWRAVQVSVTSLPSSSTVVMDISDVTVAGYLGTSLVVTVEESLLLSAVLLLVF